MVGLRKLSHRNVAASNIDTLFLLRRPREKKGKNV